jgi:peptidoglycan-associated lipoprotein
MKRTRKQLWLATLALAVLIPACAKKTPTPPSEIPQPIAPTQPREEIVQPRPMGEGADKTATDLPSDITALNEYLARNGLLGDVYFDFDKADLTEDARMRLSKNADWLKANPAFQATIEGHCDERGTAEYNLALGEKRALAAKTYLVSLGVPADRLRTVSYGKEFPFDPGHDEGAWSKNRRAHFVVTSK